MAQDTHKNIVIEFPFTGSQLLVKEFFFFGIVYTPHNHRIFIKLCNLNFFLSLSLSLSLVFIVEKDYQNTFLRSEMFWPVANAVFDQWNGMKFGSEISLYDERLIESKLSSFSSYEIHISPKSICCFAVGFWHQPEIIWMSCGSQWN